MRASLGYLLSILIGMKWDEVYRGDYELWFREEFGVTKFCIIMFSFLKQLTMHFIAATKLLTFPGLSGVIKL